jgi:hypothetical protein
MKMNLIILVITSLFLNQACGDKEKVCHKTIIFKNTTADTLYVVSSFQYPDTSTFVGIPNPVLDPNFTKVLPNESNTQVLWGRDCLELDFKFSIPSDTIMIYVFDAEVLEETPWDTVKANYLVLKRCDLSLEDLQRMNWTINYP